MNVLTAHPTIPLRAKKKKSIHKKFNFLTKILNLKKPISSTSYKTHNIFCFFSPFFTLEKQITYMNSFVSQVLTVVLAETIC